MGTGVLEGIVPNEDKGKKMKDFDLEELGKKIGEEVYKFVDPKDLEGIRKEIRESAEKVMTDFRLKTQTAADFMKRDIEIRWGGAEEGMKKEQTPHREDGSPWKNRESRTVAGQKWEAHGANGQGAKNFRLSAGKTGRKVLGIVLQVVGILLSFVFFSLTIVFGGTALCLNQESAQIIWVITGLLVCMLAGGIGLTVSGSRMRRLAGSFQRYLRIIGDREVCEISDLASGTGRGQQEVRKQLRYMLRKGWFPEGRMDQKESCLILTRDAYGHYLKLMEQQALQQAQEQEYAREEEVRMQDPAYRKLKMMITEGGEYIRRIREINDEIPGEEISAKLDRLEIICGKIFDHVEKNPEKLPHIRKLMSYYLPTVLKLLEAYLVFEKEKAEGNNVRRAQEEIEEALDDINTAFEKMYDKLFEKDTLDISTDISALSVMLGQEGLLEDDFDL